MRLKERSRPSNIKVESESPSADTEAAACYREDAVGKLKKMRTSS